MKEVKEKYLKEIYLNILKAIIIVLYFFILNLAYENISSEYLEIGIKLFTMIFLFMAIFIFERAYKKDDDNLAIQGIEILVLSAYTLTSKHITNKFNFEFKSYSLVASYIFAIYFILKCIVVYTKGRKEEAEDLSDIKEIVKKDEPLKKEATKKIKEDMAKDAEKETEKTEKNEEKIEKEIPKKSKTTKNAVTKNATSKKSPSKKSEATKKDTTAKKKTTTTKKTTTNKKSTSTKGNADTKKETAPKKTTTKKETSKKVENKEPKIEKAEDEKQESEQPKRKRVKKEVKEND